MKWFLLLAVPVAAALLAGCSGDQVTVAQTPARPSIAVVGHGEIDAPSDTGYINLGIQSQGKSVAEARDKAAKAADDVITSAKSNGIDAKDLKTSALNINPQYDYPKNGGQPTITGYVVTNNVEVKVRKLETFSKVLDDATRAGGDDVRVGGIRFDVGDNTAALAQARERAMNDAKQKADQLAKLGGVALGKPLTINETQSTRPPSVAVAAPAARGAQDTSIPTPIQPGTGTVSVDLSVVWNIE